MGKQYKAMTMKPTPVVEIHKVEGSKFKGKLLDKGVPRGKFNKLVFSFAFIDTDMDLVVKDENTGDYVPVQSISVGEKVSVFAPTTLAQDLALVPLNETITITYKGRGENKKGNPPYLFNVEGE